ncbi:TetR/AcrR family transcriptional regulator [Nocardioides pelophilus]|uniref:TetR/AcrR family transcriptional regulator n=1 Tax=Nocardioides pelophilus TaxID=2172019 RepID=UPI001C7E8602|nr:TetR/AcrR family transcriptional regulator [Nocardioides pelophilus]
MTSLRKGEATQQRMVASMLELIQSHGYAGTGLNAVLAHSGAPKGSLYFHFPEGKEQLGERAVGLAADHFESMIVAVLDSAGPKQSAGKVAESMVALLSEFLETNDFEVGCPVSVVALEMGGESDRLRTACEQAYDRWIAPVAEFLVARGHERRAAQSTASAVISLVEGAMIVARTRRDVQPLRDAARTLRTLLDLPPATKGRK